MPPQIDRRSWSRPGVVLVVALLLCIMGGVDTILAEEESSCVSCHTSVKKLVDITRQLAAERSPTESAETTGEG
jgi:hypothetical protein